jgi:hypothetical protein
MPTHLELAMLSKQVYFNNGGHVHGWTCREYYKDEHGLAAAAYENDKNEMVIAFRGTDISNFNNFLKNLMTNFQIILGKGINTTRNAEVFVQKIRDNRTSLERLKNYFFTWKANQLYLTGHSLGGTLAQSVGFAMLKIGKQYHVISFENPGIAHLLSKNELTRYAAQLQNRFITYLADPNLVNTRHSHIGAIRRIQLKPYSATFISKGMYYKTYLTDCVINEALRIILFLLIVNVLISRLFGENSLTNIIASTTNQLSAYLPNQEYSKERDNNDPMEILLFFMKCLIIIGKIITRAVTTSSQQHTIDAIIAELTKGKGFPAHCSDMQQWPNHKQFLLSQTQIACRWFNPLKSPGLLTLTKASELHEENIKNTDGYKEMSKTRQLS